MTAVGLTILIMLILVILFMPREWAAVGVIAGVLYLTGGQQVFIGGFNFFSLRFIEIAGFVRIVSKREFSLKKINKIDKYFIAFQSIYLIMFIIRSNVDPSLIETWSYRVGFYCDGVMSYFILRGLLQSPSEFKQFLKRSAILIIPFAILMVIEGSTGRNLYSLMGGVPETPVLRDGHYRSQGSFGVAITAGSFGATVMPLFIYLALIAKERLWGIVGIIACLIIIIASHSSGPLMAFIAGIVAWMCWSFRKRMKLVRWGIVLLLIFLQLLMKAPIWFIFSRLSDILGGDGWHRANLIDQFVNHFKDWWLMGMSLEKTGDWAATRLENGAVDVTNAYISLGIGGGLITVILFIGLLIICFKLLGKSIKCVRGVDKQGELLLWGIGSALITHIVNIMAVRYWDQMYMVWYMALAVVSSMTAFYLNARIIVNTDNKKADNCLTK